MPLRAFGWGRACGSDTPDNALRTPQAPKVLRAVLPTDRAVRTLILTYKEADGMPSQG